MVKKIYIVMCHTIYNGDFPYYIDSVWTSERKAIKRKNELNSAEKSEWRDEYGYGLFTVEQECVSK